MAFLFLLVIVGFLGFRLTSGSDRRQLLVRGVALGREMAIVAQEEYLRQEPFRARLRARTRYAIVTPILAAAVAGLFIAMVFGAGAPSDPATLVGWGASFGPATTNGGWWRLLTSAFVHDGFFRTVIEAAALVQVGMLLERLVGRPAVAAVFCGAAILGGIVNVAITPMGVTYGTSGAVFGFYGLLLTSAVRGLHARRAGAIEEPVAVQPAPESLTVEPAGQHEVLDNPDAVAVALDPTAVPAEAVEAPAQPVAVIVPVSAYLWLAPVSVLFFLSVLSQGAFAFKADMAGLAVGIAAGAALTGGIVYRMPTPRRVLGTSGVMAIVLVAYAMPQRGIADVRPEISRIIALEDKTRTLYQTALDRFNKGAASPDALAQLIERSIVPELDAADAHLLSIQGVPAEHRPLVANADEYLRLRSTSWRLRAESWRSRVRARKGEAEGTLSSDASWHQTKAQFRADAATRGKAEGSERASLEALQRLKATS